MQIPSVATELKQQLINNTKPQDSKATGPKPTPVPTAVEEETAPADNKGANLDLKA